MEQLGAQLIALTARVAQLEEQKGRSSRNSSKPPSSDGPGFKPTSKEKGSGRKRGAQQGHPGHGPGLLPAEKCKEVIPHRPTVCRGCGAPLAGDDSQPLRHQVVEIPPTVPVVIEHLLHRLSCPCCRTVTTAVLSEGVESSGYGARLSSLVGLLGSVYHLSHRKVQGLLNQVLSIPISTGAINACPASTPLAGWRQSSWPVRGSDRPQVVAGDNLGAMAVEATRKLSHPIPRTHISTGFF